ncbi:MAG: serine hydrolase [Eisenbergiella sp.]
MLLEEKFLEFHRYASSHNLPLEAISVGDENKVLCEMHYAANAPRNIYSHTKSFTVTAVGLAMEEGKLSLEDHVAEVFKDKLPSNPDPNLEKIQLKHLLCMSSGFGKALLMNADRRPGVGAPDYEKYMMAQPVPVEPGSAFCYSSADSILAAHMVERAVGKRMGEYLYEKVFQPLDMGWPLWEHDPQGHPNGGGGMYLTCTEMMKLGQLYLAEGNWKGEQIVSRDWVQEVYLKQLVKADKMMPATQMVFLELLYMEDEESVLKSEVANKLNLTKTSITRATAQLEGMGLIRQMKSGTEIAIKRNYTRKEYYENAKAYLINPVQKEITIMRCEATFESFSAGETALSQESELNPPRIEERAIYKGEEVVDQLEIVDARSEDPDDCLKVQLWKYNPSYFAREGCVDPVSLACTFKGNEDERIEMSIEKLLEEL